METYFFISLIFFVLATAILVYKKPKLNITTKISLGTISFISILFYAFYIFVNHITGQGITNEIFFYVTYGLSTFKGAGLSQFLTPIILSSTVFLFGLVFVYKIILYRNVKTAVNHSKKLALITLFLLVTSFTLNPLTHSLLKNYTQKNIENHTEHYTSFLNHFETPKLNTLDTPKNFIFIYAESIERTYFNQEVFPNITPQLRNIESESVSFTNVEQDAYSGHSIGGVIASLCGFPLIAPSHPNSMSGVDTYLAGATCLGDLLKKEGYHLTYYMGPNLDFAGTGKFFNTHGFSEVKGLHELYSEQEHGSYKSDWGLYDDSLFDLTFKRFSQLSEQDERFGIFIATMDTHAPLGYVSQRCIEAGYGDLDNSILNSVACSDYLISEFIKKVRTSPYSDNTVIIVASDHLAMKNTATDLLNTLPRKQLFLVNEPHTTSGSQIDISGLTLDIGPTILPFIGYETNIGLGRDIRQLQPTETSRKETIDLLTEEFKKYLVQFWSFPQVQNVLEVDPRKNKLSIDKQSFSLPILIEFNRNLETTIKFEFSPTEQSLHSQLQPLSPDYRFLLVESCHTARSLVNEITEDDAICMVTENTDGYRYVPTLDKQSFSKKELLEFLQFAN